MKLCVLFPGIGYHCGKPLLRLSAELAADKGYKVMPLQYTDFPEGAKGNDDIMRKAIDHAIGQTERQLGGISFGDHERVVFIGKSIGTAASLAFREKSGIKAECILLTPLEMTFEYPVYDCVAFHGTADQWAETPRIENLCSQNDVRLYEYENANHSLMTGDPARDSIIAEDVIAKIAEII